MKRTLLAIQAGLSFSWTYFYGTVECQDLLTLPLVPHHEQLLRRRRFLVSASSSSSSEYDDKNNHPLQLGALYQGFGTHYVDLWVGTPPQRQTLIVDTGSSVTAFPCDGCRSCGSGYHIDALFHENRSSTFQRTTCDECQKGECHKKKVVTATNSGGTTTTTTNNLVETCRIQMRYKEGSSWYASESTDVVYMGGPHDHGLLHEVEDDNDNEVNKDEDMDPKHAKSLSFNMMFGCQNKLTGLFVKQLADGILGMDNTPTSFWSQAHAEGVMPTPTFSLCYSRQPTAKRSGTEAGALTLGGYDSRLHTSPVVYANANNNDNDDNDEGSSSYYLVQIRRVYLRAGGGDSARIHTNKDAIVPLPVRTALLNAGENLVDSGTTSTYFNRFLFHQFTRQFQKMTGKAFPLLHQSVKWTHDQVEALPTILIQLRGDKAYNRKLYPKAVTGLAGSLDGNHTHDVLLAIPPSHYLVWDPKTQTYAASLYVDGGDGMTLGASTMMGHDFVFDTQRGRIGIAESTCDYTTLLAKHGFSNNQATTTTTTTSTSSQKAAFQDDDDDDTDWGKAVDSDGGKKKHSLDGCTSWSCRGVALGVLFMFAAVGVLVLGGSCSSLSSSSSSSTSNQEYQYHQVTANKEFGTNDMDDDDEDDDDNADEEEGGLEMTTTS